MGSVIVKNANAIDRILCYFLCRDVSDGVRHMKNYASKLTMLIAGL